MNPYDEKRLRDEVIYLHYLWQQGPPQSSNQTPRKRPAPSTRNPMNKRKSVHSGPYPPPPRPDQGLDWSALAEPTPPSSSAWTEPKSKPDPPVKPVSVEDQARFASMQMQNKVLESCKLFFNRRVQGEENDDDDVDEEEEMNEVDMFLMRVFVNNSELRGYYDENHEQGEFFCLVCGGIGENAGKKFKGCAGLVQHCMSISKTKSRISHRAFGLVVCKVLGWDIDRLPVILLKGEPLSRSLARESQEKGGDLTDIMGIEESTNVDGTVCVEREVSSISQSNGELMNSLKDDGANETVESLKISDGEPNKGAVTDLGLDSSQITTTGWPRIEHVDESTSTTLEWPSFAPCTAPFTHTLSAEEKIRVDMVQVQVNVFEACKQFLSTTAESDSDEDDEFDGDNVGDGPRDSEEFNFFLRLFTENNGLRSYYETNCRGGDFWCLVCRGIGKKDWRTFRDCVGLIQHSTRISKTKRKRAHRAFGQVVCKVLNWDIDHLPSISLKSESQKQSLEDLSQGLGLSQVMTNGWPCIEPVDESTSTTLEWPSFTPCTAPITHVLSAEDQIRVDMVQVQVNIFEACKQFLSTPTESDSDDDNEFDEDGDGDGSKDGEEFNFFLRLFTENSGLCSYYETNCRGGDFWCLVCRGIGKKDWRTFKDCVGLIQHSTAISKTKRKRAHRAFGLVICKVLNWDIDHLPSTKSEPQSHSSEDSSQNTLNREPNQDV